MVVSDVSSLCTTLLHVANVVKHYAEPHLLGMRTMGKHMGLRANICR